MDLHPYDTVCHDTTRHDKITYEVLWKNLGKIIKRIGRLIEL
jgi:hypothetical protein